MPNFVGRFNEMKDKGFWKKKKKKIIIVLKVPTRVLGNTVL